MSQYASSILFSIDTALQKNGGVHVGAIAAALSLTYQSSTIQILTNSSGGAIDVKLPAPTYGTGALKSGLQYWIRNDDSSNAGLNINHEGGGTLLTIAAGEVALVACDGTNWALVITV